MKIHSWDKVQVIAWKDNGKQWKVISVNKIKNKILVEGINIVTKHIKKQWNTPWQIVKIEKFIDVSNVMLVCPHTNSLTKVWFKIENWKKSRFSKKSWKNI